MRRLSCCSIALAVAALLSPLAAAQEIPTPPSADTVISGRVVDAVGGFPLDGIVGDEAGVQLQHCNDGVCVFVDQADVEPGGAFRFELDAESQGAFALVARALGYQEGSVDVRVEAGAPIDVGELALTPPAVTVTDLQVCEGIPSVGGVCAYSVRVRNNTDEPLLATAVGRVNTGATLFEVGNTLDTEGVQRPQVEIPPFDSQEVAFAFDVPAALPDGRRLCANLYLGYDPFPLFAPTRVDRQLFCITKGR